jgi:hypothetical protein
LRPSCVQIFVLEGMSTRRRPSIAYPKT